MAFLALDGSAVPADGAAVMAAFEEEEVVAPAVTVTNTVVADGQTGQTEELLLVRTALEAEVAISEVVVVLLVMGAEVAVLVGWTGM